MAKPKKLTLTVQEAAELLGISATLAYKLANEEGNLAGVPVIRLGKRMVVSKAAFEETIGKTS